MYLFFPLTCSAIFGRVLEIYQPERCLPSLEYNGTRRNSACGAQSAEKKKKKSEIMTESLKIIHKLCCEQFLVGTFFLSPKLHHLTTKREQASAHGQEACAHHRYGCSGSKQLA